MIAGAIAIYAGFIAWATVPTPYFLFAAALLSGCGLACGSSATINAIIGAGFSSDRAKALGIALNGTAFGGFLLLPLLTFGGRTFGWIWTLAILGAAAIAILTWMSAALNDAGQQNGLAPKPGPANVPMSRGALIRSPRFLSLTSHSRSPYSCRSAFYSQLINHLRPMLGLDGATLAMTGCIVFAIAGRSAVALEYRPGEPACGVGGQFPDAGNGRARPRACARRRRSRFSAVCCSVLGSGKSAAAAAADRSAAMEFDEQSFTLVVSTVSAVSQSFWHSVR